MFIDEVTSLGGVSGIEDPTRLVILFLDAMIRYAVGIMRGRLVRIERQSGRRYCLGIEYKSSVIPPVKILLTFEITIDDQAHLYT